MPLNVEEDAKYFDDAIKEYIDAFESEKLLTKTGSGYVYSGTINPIEKVGLESFTSETFTVIYNGMLLETMDRSQAFRDAHTGAVLMHQGETYLVKELDINSAIATVEKRVLDYYTESLKTVMVQPDKPFKTKTYGSFQVSLARLNVEERHTGYNVKRYDSIIKKVPLDLPPIEFSTVGFTFTVPYQIKHQVSDLRMDFAGGLHGVEHAMIGILPLQVMCDRWDLGGVSIPGIGRGASSEITIYDGYAGGIGLSEKAFDLFEDLLEITYELVNDCKCDNGCPACVYSPKCGNDNKPLDKEAAKLILKLLLQEIQSPRSDSL
jgi:DEAD/DEAH box helicase domain-containing protein